MNDKKINVIADYLADQVKGAELLQRLRDNGFDKVSPDVLMAAWLRVSAEACIDFIKSKDVFLSTAAKQWDYVAENQSSSLLGSLTPIPNEYGQVFRISVKGSKK